MWFGYEERTLLLLLLFLILLSLLLFLSQCLVTFGAKSSSLYSFYLLLSDSFVTNKDVSKCVLSFCFSLNYITYLHLSGLSLSRIALLHPFFNYLLLCFFLIPLDPTSFFFVRLFDKIGSVIVTQIFLV